MEYIRIATLLETPLIISRDNVLRIEERICEIDSYPLNLDFSGIEFVSASFSQEFLALLKRIGEEKVNIINITPSVQSMINTVRARKPENRKIQVAYSYEIEEI